jgi:hypothetical protein
VVVVLLVDAIAFAELVALDGREEVDTVVALVAEVVLAATSIARPITPNAAKLKTVATMRARAAACGRRRAIGQPPTGPACGGVTMLVPVLVPTPVPVLVPGSAAATPLPAVPVCGGVTPMPVPGCAGATPPCCGMVPHWPSSGPSSPHGREMGFVGVALGNGADW